MQLLSALLLPEFMKVTHSSPSLVEVEWEDDLGLRLELKAFSKLDKKKRDCVYYNVSVYTNNIRLFCFDTKDYGHAIKEIEEWKKASDVWHCKIFDFITHKQDKADKDKLGKGWVWHQTVDKFGIDVANKYLAK